GVTSRLSVTPRHTFVLDLAPSEADLLRGMDGAERKIRKAEREGVVVRPVESAADLAAFCQLSHETSDRVRARTAYTDFPPAFFASLHARMAPTGGARFYVAWHDTAPLARCGFLPHGGTMLYYLGGAARRPPGPRAHGEAGSGRRVLARHPRRQAARRPRLRSRRLHADRRRERPAARRVRLQEALGRAARDVL